MKLNFLLFAMALAAMGPAREAAVPSVVPDIPLPQPQSPEEVEAPAVPEAEAVAITEYDASSVLPEQFRWVARPVVVFADAPEDPAFREQLEALRSRPDALVERDVVVITDADPEANSPWRQLLHPRGFSLVVMDKDGQVKLRKPLPWDAREISRAIDKFPLRRQEIGRAGVMP
ncbi:DUF4174 domain-containing protein [Paracoccus seriniphilus]|uniref:DUF4174 domain-containing protein n=1 Tax=Paracoccus seriniphilus TaxID=184748 RepID=UPI000B78BBD9|nr:DUF4174 domain-containing protein [Paracoccus seriniphilus]WCR13006.1 DUF4174 domain-containing protein [Paracoccus seriniphilus]